MPNVIHVLKPFTFSYAAVGERIAREKLFTPGLHEVDDEVYNHPYIRDHFADGRIEKPEATAKRLAAQEAKRKEDEQLAAVATARAQTAFSRLKAADANNGVSAADIERELNTPVSQLKTVQGGDIAQPVTTLKLKNAR